MAKEKKEDSEIKEKIVEEIKETPEKKLTGKELEKAAKKESLELEKEEKTSAKDLEQKKKALLEKAAKLKSKVEGAVDIESMKEEVKAKKKSDMLIDLEDYVKTGIYLGTRVVTPDMKKYVYRRRADGLAIFNTDLIDEKLKEGIEYLSKFNPEDVILVCKRQSGWKVAKKFEEVTGIRAFTKKYPAGIMTNTELEDFLETELTIITDHWLDKNALKDTLDVKKKVLMICGTNNFAHGANQIIIGNNKSGKSIGLIYYLLAKGYLKARGKDTSIVPDMDWWIDEDEE
jgi:small subunit ribosomal protein S2